MAFYSIFFLLFFGLGIGFLIPVFLDYFSSGVVERFPTLIACCFSLLVGILCLFSGFLFSTLLNQDKASFERSLISAESQFKTKKDQKL